MNLILFIKKIKLRYRLPLVYLLSYLSLAIIIGFFWSLYSFSPIKFLYGILLALAWIIMIPYTLLIPVLIPVLGNILESILDLIPLDFPYNLIAIGIISQIILLGLLYMLGIHIEKKNSSSLFIICGAVGIICAIIIFYILVILKPF